MHRAVRVFLLVVAVGLVAALPIAVLPVAAHEHVTVGEYELIVGWRNEPAVAGTMNGLDLGIQHHFPNGTTVWVVGVAGNLTASLSIGPFHVNKTLDPQFGRDGWYTFDVIPTRPGTYTVRLKGTLGTTAVNVSVDLDPVNPASDYQFPVVDPTSSDLQSRLDAANIAIAGLQQLTLALVIGLLGIVAAAGLATAWRISRAQRKGP